MQIIDPEYWMNDKEHGNDKLIFLGYRFSIFLAHADYFKLFTNYLLVATYIVMLELIVPSYKIIEGNERTTSTLISCGSSSFVTFNNFI